MDFIDLALKRTSIRKYKDEKPEHHLVLQVLEAGRLAPSAKNVQPWHFVLVEDRTALDAVCEAYPRDWLRTAPIIIVVCIDRAAAWTRRDGRSYADVDGAIAMDHMSLCATSLGLGTCWIGAFDREKLSAALELPDGIEPLVMSPLGIPDESGLEKKRKALSDTLHRNRW